MTAFVERIEQVEQEGTNCPGDCPKCRTGRVGRQRTAGQGLLAGRRMALAAIAAFLLPLALAITGAALGSRDDDGIRQVLYGALGLAVGVVVAVVAGRLFWGAGGVGQGRQR